MGTISKITGLPDDILAEVLARLNVRDISSLRLSCKRLNTATYSRDLWATFALRRILAQGLPWPEYALPLTNLPTETIEALCIRAVMMKERWDSRTEYSWTGNRVSTMLAVSRKHSAGPVTYLGFIRSRWLVVGTKSGYIHIWDILNPEVLGPAMSWGVMTGSPDSGVIRDLGNNGIFLIISTHLGYTYRLHLDPPYIAEPRLRFGWSVRPVALFGYHGVLDVREDMIAFSRSDLDHNAHIVSDSSGGIVRLLPNTWVVTKSMAMQIRSHVIVVANSCRINIYSAADAFRALHESSVIGSVGSVGPLQSLNYPNHRMVWYIGLVRPEAYSDVPGISAGDDSANSDIIMNVFIAATIYRWWLRSADTGEGEGFPRFSWVVEPDVATKIHGKFFTRLCWGNSGTRLAYVGGSDMSKPILVGGVRLPKPAGASVLPTWEDQKYCELDDDAFAFSWTCAFDDAAGLIATATTTGRVWLVDATRSNSSTISSNLTIGPNASASPSMSLRQYLATHPTPPTDSSTLSFGEASSRRSSNTSSGVSPDLDPAAPSAASINSTASRDTGCVHEARRTEQNYDEDRTGQEQHGNRQYVTDDRRCGSEKGACMSQSPEARSHIICAPASCPPPLPWPEWSPVNAVHRPSVSVCSLSSYLALGQVAIDAADIPPGWKNDWSAYEYFADWADHYGSLQWWFDDVLRIPGKARPVLYRDPQEMDEEVHDDDEGDWEPPDGPDVIIELQGCFLHEHGAWRTRLITGGMEEILESLRGDRPLKLGVPWWGDDNASRAKRIWGAYAKRTSQSVPSSRAVAAPPYLLSQVIPADLQVVPPTAR